jgi:hypothetical protein
VQPAGELDEVLAGVVGRERVEAQFAQQREYPVLPRADPLTTQLHDGTRVAGDRCVEGAAANPVAGLQDPNLVPAGGQFMRGDQARHPGPDHHHVRLVHGRLPRSAGESQHGIYRDIRPALGGLTPSGRPVARPDVTFSYICKRLEPTADLVRVDRAT